MSPSPKRLTNLLGIELKPSDLVPVTIVDDTVLYITENSNGEEETIVIGTMTHLLESENINDPIVIKGPQGSVNFPPGANRIISAGFVVSIESDETFPSVSVQVE